MKCPHCGYENKEGARFCNLCQKSFVKDDTESGGVREPSELYGLAPLAEPSQEAKKAVETILRGQPTELNWFQRHLNWTWVIAQCAAYLIGQIIVTVFVSSLFFGGTTLPSEASLLASVSVIQLAFVALQTASVFGVGAWVLHRKNRSLWWLLILLVPLVGWIIFLLLENQSEPPPLPESLGSTIQPGLAPPGLGHRSDKYGP